MKNALLLHGLTAAVHTPFNKDGALNLACVEKQAAHLVENGIHTAFIGGSTGESHSLSLEERLALATRWKEVTRSSSLKVVVHVGANCIADARQLAAQAQQLGVAAISALCPSYFKPKTMDVLIDCCVDIASAAPEIPFYYYDIPVLTGVLFSMFEFLEKAPARIPNLAGLKYTNSDLGTYLLCLQAGSMRWDIPWGIDECLLAALATGAQGAVGSTYNFAAPLCHGIIGAFKRGDMAAARNAQYRNMQLISLLARYGYMGAAKATMAMLGVEVGPARLPNARLSSESIIQLRRELEVLGFFDWIRH